MTKFHHLLLHLDVDPALAFGSRTKPIARPDNKAKPPSRIQTRSPTTQARALPHKQEPDQIQSRATPKMNIWQGYVDCVTLLPIPAMKTHKMNSLRRLLSQFRHLRPQ